MYACTVSVWPTDVVVDPTPTPLQFWAINQSIDHQVLGLLLARRLNVIRRPFEIFGQYVLTQQVNQQILTWVGCLSL